MAQLVFLIVFVPRCSLEHYLLADQDNLNSANKVNQNDFTNTTSPLIVPFPNADTMGKRHIVQVTFRDNQEQEDVVLVVPRDEDTPGYIVCDYIEDIIDRVERRGVIISPRDFKCELRLGDVTGPVFDDYDRILSITQPDDELVVVVIRKND
jgi:hypothetical protein